MICVNDFLEIYIYIFSLIQIGYYNQIYKQPSDKHLFEVKMKVLLY